MIQSVHNFFRSSSTSAKPVSVPAREESEEPADSQPASSSGDGVEERGEDDVWQEVKTKKKGKGGGGRPSNASSVAHSRQSEELDFHFDNEIEGCSGDGVPKSNGPSFSHSFRHEKILLQVLLLPHRNVRLLE